MGGQEAYNYCMGRGPGVTGGPMGHKLYYIDSYGHVQRDRKAEQAQSQKKKPSSRGGLSPVKVVMWTLIAMALVMVLASLH